MQAACGHCGEEMIVGRVGSEWLDGTDPRLFFVVGAGTPTSLNPIKAVL
jgi:hypothetical protein